MSSSESKAKTCKAKTRTSKPHKTTTHTLTYRWVMLAQNRFYIEVTYDDHDDTVKIRHSLCRQSPSGQHQVVLFPDLHGRLDKKDKDGNRTAHGFQSGVKRFDPFFPIPLTNRKVSICLGPKNELSGLLPQYPGLDIAYMDKLKPIPSVPLMFLPKPMAPCMRISQCVNQVQSFDVPKMPWSKLPAYTEIHARVPFYLHWVERRDSDGKDINYVGRHFFSSKNTFPFLFVCRDVKKLPSLAWVRVLDHYHNDHPNIRAILSYLQNINVLDAVEKELKHQERPSVLKILGEMKEKRLARKRKYEKSVVGSTPKRAKVGNDMEVKEMKTHKTPLPSKFVIESSDEEEDEGDDAKGNESKEKKTRDSKHLPDWKRKSGMQPKKLNFDSDASEDPDRTETDVSDSDFDYSRFDSDDSDVDF
jgi:hypothetical protein